MEKLHEFGLVQLRRYIVAFKLHILATREVGDPKAKLVFSVDVYMPNKKSAMVGKPSTHIQRCEFNPTTKILNRKGRPLDAANVDVVANLIEEKIKVYFRYHTVEGTDESK